MAVGTPKRANPRTSDKIARPLSTSGGRLSTSYESAAALRPTRLATGLFLLLLLAVTLHFLGLRRELSYVPLVDESAFVPRAMAIVVTGDLNPGWFGHPGSTLVYPLALVIHLGYVTLYDGVLFHANPAISILFEENSAPFLWRDG